METLGDFFNAGKDFFLHLNWQNFSLDLFIVAFFVGMVFLYSFVLGRNRMITIVLTLYVSLALFNSLPYLNPWLDRLDINFFAWRVLLFVLVFAVLFYLLSKYALKEGFSSKRGLLWQNLLYSFFLVGFIMNIVLYLIPVDFTKDLAPFAKMVFLSVNSRFFWTLTPLLAMLILKIKDKKEEE